MIYPWKLDYWSSGEWQVCNERLKALEKAGITYNPSRAEIFKSLATLPLGDVRVVLMGQDPYPDSRFATGLAFSVPRDIKKTEYPPTLNTIFKEYTADLRYPVPDTGDLSGWAAQGCLLWNAVPTCRQGQSLSHDWTEYSQLTREIVEKLSARGIVFALLGSVARRYLDYIDLGKNEVILTSHPSPRGIKFSKTPFEGSRLFSTINDKLNGLGLDTINWRIDDGSDLQRPGLEGLGRDESDGVLSKVLENITGASCGPVRDSRGVLVRE